MSAPTAHKYEVRPRKDHRGVDLISDVLPFGLAILPPFRDTSLYGGRNRRQFAV
jgi:hypothetical protein